MTERRVAITAVAVVLLYGIYNAWNSLREYAQPNKATIAPSLPTTPIKQRDTFHYIVSVIRHGSSQLHFKPTEVMEGGFAEDEDAADVACYVLHLRHERCIEGNASRGSLIFSSNCAGCHGNDGKGLHGTYPDLTRKPLLGMER